MFKYWGYKAFRDRQQDIVKNVLDGKDTLALLPTGGGKSICYQVPALVKPGLCLVVSPLIALMHDQVENLKKRGIKAIAITSGMSKKQIDIQLDNAIYGDTKLLYVSPERLKTTLFIARFQKMNVNLIAIDEAHCISQWGYDFRPAYLEIAELRKLKPNIPLLALTATATEQVVTDIQEKLLFVNGAVIRKSFFRPNLTYSAFLVPNKRNRIEEYLRQHNGSGIIYCATRKGVKELASYLLSKNCSIDYYHAGLDFDERRQKQENWLSEKTRVIVSTNAFGMGIDKPNVRFVLHYDIPETIEAYFQEAGRAGRDEKPAEAHLYFDEHDITALIEKVNTKFPPVEKIKSIYNALGNHFQLAFGAGKEERYPIEINAFCNKYNFQLLEVYNALKFLETTGYLELSEGTYTPAKLKITATQIQLYQEQVKDKNMNTLIQFILRSHMGVFDEYVNINEFIIGQKIKLTKKEVVEKLNYLQKLELIDYVPQSDEPHVTYLTERLPDSNLSFSPRFYKDRKDLAFEKMKAMIRYLESDECKSVVLLRYFGEEETADCGFCSSCILKKMNSGLSGLLKKLDSFIAAEFTREDTIETAKIIDHFNTENRSEVLHCLRQLADLNKIQIDATGQKISKLR
ncbi:MAG: RecQ family ATP-dependent DNA helicase [Bacteroidetes bacterium]|nr:RecQ family ATP-dependent DNA helicase [Bacteroidota bacterium]